MGHTNSPELNKTFKYGLKSLTAESDRKDKILTDFEMMGPHNGATTLGITTLSIRNFYVTLSISDSQHK